MPTTKPLFCAVCQVKTEQEFSAPKSPNGEHELIATCTQCKHQVKFPANITADELKAYFDQHHIHNQGQVPASDVKIADDHPVLKELERL